MKSSHLKITPGCFSNNRGYSPTLVHTRNGSKSSQSQSSALSKRPLEEVTQSQQDTRKKYAKESQEDFLCIKKEKCDNSNRQKQHGEKRYQHQEDIEKDATKEIWFSIEEALAHETFRKSLQGEGEEHEDGTSDKKREDFCSFQKKILTKIHENKENVPSSPSFKSIKPSQIDNSKEKFTKSKEENKQMNNNYISQSVQQSKMNSQYLSCSEMQKQLSHKSFKSSREKSPTVLVKQKKSISPVIQNRRTPVQEQLNLTMKRGKSTPKLSQLKKSALQDNTKHKSAKSNQLNNYLHSNLNMPLSSVGEEKQLDLRLSPILREERGGDEEDDDYEQQNVHGFFAQEKPQSRLAKEIIENILDKDDLFEKTRQENKKLKGRVLSLEQQLKVLLAQNNEIKATSNEQAIKFQQEIIQFQEKMQKLHSFQAEERARKKNLEKVEPKALQCLNSIGEIVVQCIGTLVDQNQNTLLEQVDVDRVKNQLILILVMLQGEQQIDWINKYSEIENHHIKIIQVYDIDQFNANSLIQQSKIASQPISLVTSVPNQSNLLNQNSFSQFISNNMNSGFEFSNDNSNSIQPPLWNKRLLEKQEESWIRESNMLDQHENKETNNIFQQPNMNLEYGQNTIQEEQEKINENQLKNEDVDTEDTQLDQNQREVRRQLVFESDEKTETESEEELDERQKEQTDLHKNQQPFHEHIDQVKKQESHILSVPNLKLSALNTIDPQFFEANSEQNKKQKDFSVKKQSDEDFVVAIFDYLAQEVICTTGDKDISFKKGEKIQVISRTKNGWWIGYLNKKVGYFPCNYVKEIE